MITMKTLYILIANITLQFNSLLTSGNEELGMNTPSNDIVNLLKLAPLTPKEADFNDENTAMEINIKLLAPVTPKEADFNDAL